MLDYPQASPATPVPPSLLAPANEPYLVAFICSLLLHVTGHVSSQKQNLASVVGVLRDLQKRLTLMFKQYRIGTLTPQHKCGPLGSVFTRRRLPRSLVVLQGQNRFYPLRDVGC